MNAAMCRARVGNDYRSWFPVIATMVWFLYLKDAAFYQRKSKLRQDLTKKKKKTSEHPQLEIYLGRMRALSLGFGGPLARY
jgi:hypothetical protein